MTDERQIHIPASFIAIYTRASQPRPSASRLWLEQRHDLCEDLAQLLAEQAKNKVWQLGIDVTDALARIEQGLPEIALDLSALECTWVMTRVKEILDV